jgi:hypothetical protein
MKLNLEVRVKVGEKEVYSVEHDGFCRATAAWLSYWQMANAVNVTNTSGGAAAPGQLMSVAAPATNATYGPVVGTGTGAFDFDNQALGTLIAHGNGAGQLQYGATTFTAPQTVGNDRYFEIIRTFQNASGSDITVNEIGLYGNSSSVYYCLAREVIGGGILVPNGQTLTVTYKIKVSL